MGIAMTFNEEMLDVARAAYLAARGESDLIPIKEAATLVDRTVPTLKKWIKREEISGVRENPENPREIMYFHCFFHGILGQNPFHPRLINPETPRLNRHPPA